MFIKPFSLQRFIWYIFIMLFSAGIIFFFQSAFNTEYRSYEILSILFTLLMTFHCLGLATGIHDRLEKKEIDMMVSQLMDEAKIQYADKSTYEYQKSNEEDDVIMNEIEEFNEKFELAKTSWTMKPFGERNDYELYHYWLNMRDKIFKSLLFVSSFSFFSLAVNMLNAHLIPNELLAAICTVTFIAILVYFFFNKRVNEFHNLSPYGLKAFKH
ncbi:hypothetical protein M3202_19805 [Alkalihalobacillus oceani]|uniref:Uncharacterized protein n=1 Tax=Halalkalibacter oceani TaxID=1653776 RepID=A0A9X2DW31_9BACI|nr:hypothetical protein [Halalkalibacter oceani]MCM3716293.1 hypothetical protein [Halalkalibacter oceani]